MDAQNKRFIFMTSKVMSQILSYYPFFVVFTFYCQPIRLKDNAILISKDVPSTIDVFDDDSIFDYLLI